MSVFAATTGRRRLPRVRPVTRAILQRRSRPWSPRRRRSRVIWSPNRGATPATTCGRATRATGYRCRTLPSSRPSITRGKAPAICGATAGRPVRSATTRVVGSARPVTSRHSLRMGRSFSGHTPRPTRVGWGARATTGAHPSKAATSVLSVTNGPCCRVLLSYRFLFLLLSSHGRTSRHRICGRLRWRF